MAYERLVALGPEKFKSVIAMLHHGATASAVARVIRDEWQDCHDVREDTLAKQLTRLHADIAAGPLQGSPELESAFADVRRQLGSVSTIDCLTGLDELARMMREYVLSLMARQTESKRPLRALNVVTRSYRTVLLSIQQMRFDLGIDEYKGPKTYRRTMTVEAMAALEARRAEDQRAIVAACEVVDRIFRNPSVIRTPADG